MTTLIDLHRKPLARAIQYVFLWMLFEVLIGGLFPTFMSFTLTGLQGPLVFDWVELASIASLISTAVAASRIPDLLEDDERRGSLRQGVAYLVCFTAALWSAFISTVLQSPRSEAIKSHFIWAAFIVAALTLVYAAWLQVDRAFSERDEGDPSPVLYDSSGELSRMPDVSKASHRSSIRTWLNKTRHRLFDEKHDEPLPREAIALACFGGIAAVILALIIDGRNFRGYDLLVNVLATLALLGPGLIVTNVIVRDWAAKRRADAIRSELTPAVKALCTTIQRWFVVPVTRWLMLYGTTLDETIEVQQTLTADDARGMLAIARWRVQMVQLALQDASLRQLVTPGRIDGIAHIDDELRYAVATLQVWLPTALLAARVELIRGVLEEPLVIFGREAGSEFKSRRALLIAGMDENIYSSINMWKPALRICRHLDAMLGDVEALVRATPAGQHRTTQGVP